MNCHYCGAELESSARFCLHCGTRQQSLPQIPVEEPPVAVEVVQTPPPTQPVPEATPGTHRETVYIEKTFGWQPYGAPAKEEPLVDLSPTSKLQLPVKRSLWKMLLFGILTLGIYPVVIWSRLVSEVNLVASRHDGERSMPYFAAALLAPLTMGIHTLVWINKLCRRIGKELQRRSIPYSFGANDFWLWAFLMGMICAVCLGVCIALISIRFDSYFLIWLLLAVAFFTLVGPFIFVSKLMSAMNRLNEDYNHNG